MLPKKYTGKGWPDLPASNAKSRLRVNARKRLFKITEKWDPRRIIERPARLHRSSELPLP